MKTSLKSRLLLLLSFMMILGCSGEYIQNNPYDSESENTIIGKIAGKVSPSNSRAMVSAKKNGIVVESTRISGNGSFTIENLPAGKYSLLVEANDFLSDSTYTDVQVVPKTTVSIGTIYLNSPSQGTISGSVEPYNQATTVKLFSGDSLLSSTGVNENSEFNFPALEVGDYWIKVLLDGYSTYRSELIHVSAGVTTRLGIIILNDSSKGSITGIVSPRSSAAIVNLVQEDEHLDSTVIDMLTGQYVFSNLDPGIYDISVKADGFAISEIDSITVTAGETNDNNNVILEETVQIKGVVYPINSGAYVSAEFNGEIVQEVRINSFDGSYTLSTLEPGQYLISVCSDGFITEEYGETVIAEYGQTKLSRIYLAREDGNVIYGQVVAEDGGGIVTGATVKIEDEQENTDIEGYYDFFDLDPGYINLTVEKDGYVSLVTQVLIPEIGTEYQDLIITPSGNLSGRITDEESQSGIEGVRISVNQDNYVSYTDQDGYYFFEFLPAGEHSVVISHDEYFNLYETIIVYSDQNVTANYSLHLISENTGTLTGIVTDFYTGEGIEGATVQTGYYSSVTNSLGMFTAYNLLPETYNVLSSFEGYQPNYSEVEINVGETTEIEIELFPSDSLGAIPTGTLSGTLIDSYTDQEIEVRGTLPIYLSRESGNTLEGFCSCSVNEDGSYQLLNYFVEYGHPDYNTPNIPIGVYHIWCHRFYATNSGPFGYKSFDYIVEVIEGQDVVFNPSLDPLCSIGGVVVDANSGDPLECVSIAGVISDEDGIYYANHINPDTTSMFASRREYYTSGINVYLNPSEHNIVDFSLISLPVVAGTVRNAETGNVLDNVEITSASADPVETDENGHYELIYNNSGYYSINFAKPGFVSEARDLFIPQTGTIIIDMQMTQQ